MPLASPDQVAVELSSTSVEASCPVVLGVPGTMVPSSRFPSSNGACVLSVETTGLSLVPVIVMTTF